MAEVVAGEPADTYKLGAVLYRLLDRKVCNTANVVLIGHERGRQGHAA